MPQKALISGPDLGWALFPSGYQEMQYFKPSEVDPLLNLLSAEIYSAYI